MDKEVIENVETVATEEKTEENKQGKSEYQKKELKYTDEDLDRIISRRITKERERLKKMFDNEQQESELEKRERDILKRELKADAKDKLIEDGLPSQLAEVLNYDSKEDFEDSYNKITKIFKELFQQAVTSEVKKRVGGSVPKTMSLDAYKRIMNDDDLRKAFFE